SKKQARALDGPHRALPPSMASLSAARRDGEIFCHILILARISQLSILDRGAGAVTPTSDKALSLAGCLGRSVAAHLSRRSLTGPRTMSVRALIPGRPSC